MGKAETLLQAQGQAIKESAARRTTPLAMPTGGPAVALGSLRVDGSVRSKAAFDIPVSRIKPDPNQPREEFDEEALVRLAESIKSKGLLQPIAVRRAEGDGFMIVAGERRWQASRMAGLESITCIVYERDLPAAELLALQCIENLLRENLTKTEQAKAFRTLLAANNWTQMQLAEELGISQTTISQALNVLKLPEVVQAQVDSGELASTVASEIASKIDDPEGQVEVAALIVDGQLDRGQSKEVIGKAARKPASKAKGRGGKPKLPTTRTIKTEGGPKVIIEWRKGLDPATTLEALREAVAKLEAEVGKEVAA